MILYKEKLRKLLKSFPEEIFSSSKKKEGYYLSKTYEALENNYIRINSDTRINIIAIDIDVHADAGAWMDWDLPEPSWTTFTTRGVQFAWILEKPIFISDDNRHRYRDLKYAKDVLAKLVCALDADISAMAFHRVFRNPLTHRYSRFTDTRVNLKDFIDLPAPHQAWWDEVKKKNKQKVSAKKIEEEGLGRNDSLFDIARYWAYDKENRGAYNEFDLAEFTHNTNADFKEPLEQKEVKHIITSINKFITVKYTGFGGSYMSNTTPEQRKKTARKNGKKGGETKTREAYIKIAATIVQMQSFDIKITVSDVARRAKSHRDTVREYLNKKGWKEESRKVGWIKK